MRRSWVRRRREEDEASMGPSAWELPTGWIPAEASSRRSWVRVFYKEDGGGCLEALVGANVQEEEGGY